jgi:hypothetical protein
MAIENIAAEDYFSRPALNASTLKAFAKVPALAHVSREETAAMVLGSLVHCAILEPEELDKRYQATSVERRGTKAWAAAEEAAEGRELVKLPDMDQAYRMRDAVWANPTACELLTGAMTEQSAFWIDEATGLPCKARADAVNTRLNALIDVKTTVDAGPRQYARQFAKLGYGIQDIHYRTGWQAQGLEIETMVFLALEKSAPYLVALYELGADQLAAYQDKYNSLVWQYHQCAEAGIFPGYDLAIQPLELPFI